MTEPLDLDQCLKIAQSVALEAGVLILKAYTTSHLSPPSVSSSTLIQDVALKCDNEANLVTIVDRQVEALCFSALRSHFPSHSFIGEESTSDGESGQVSPLSDGPTWIIDPIDGTTNFVHGIPYCCVSIGLVVDKIPVVGVIYNPILNEMYAARTGGGVTLNGSSFPRGPRPIAPLSQCIVSAEYGNERTNDVLAPKLVAMERLIQAPVRAFRAIGSACMNLCLVARGVVDVYYEAGVHSWDMAAGIVILREAGGRVWNFFPDPNISSDYINILDRNIIAVRPGESVEAMDGLMNQIRSYLEPVHYERDT